MNQKINFYLMIQRTSQFLGQIFLKVLDITPKIKKNNESLKYLDPQVLNFLYKYTELSNDILYLDHEMDIMNIDSVDGKISTIHKKTNNKIDINIRNIVAQINLLKKFF